MITTQEVLDWLGHTGQPTADDTKALELVTAATIGYVDSLPNIDLDPSGFYWADTTKLGAIMLAARMYQRRNSPGGVTAIGDVATFVPRYDNDIARLLNLDSFTKPMVG
ncbi:hypothetical protein [Paenarthrobacter nicotinovorans]|uniref:hypothetical protein n=1 Tax=Paenarthrobacter nicotinovorans TaxID=29320 RepID=UPI00119E6520|nr:hypothetical protein [Paenarthrobacter nicotinovorans]